MATMEMMEGSIHTPEQVCDKIAAQNMVQLTLQETL